MENDILIQQLKGDEVIAYIRANTVQEVKYPSGTEISRVVKPLRVYKVTESEFGYGRVIVSLKIPVGAVIYHDPEYILSLPSIGSRKMRASKAVVVEQFEFMDDSLGFSTEVAVENGKAVTYVRIPQAEVKRGKIVETSLSQYDSNFEYHTGKTVRPTKAFNRIDVQCTTGIHFFVNLGDALAY
ncbi:hypothetical protein FDI24_gp007 [Acidovorax phage ACP17]|uniref:Uncharacterized protein n=1 Tax=Acidovorax phage ACP17 TaxID=2010329 RepID=A0A218M3C7_9CAUD|nr:hypothetical protein FDI24_gp007 [Acidovorax phage ACP17]ASD50541.1 hypothetical protein [Acidovorax phage ACP17]